MSNYNKLTQPPSPLTPIVAIATLLVVAAATLFAFAAWRQAHLHPQRKQVLQPVAPAVAPPPAAPATPAEVNAEHRAGDIDRILQRQWSHSLLAIEKASGKGVTILELHPNLEGGTFTLKGEALTFDELSAYVKRLSDTKLVRQVRLAHELAITRDNVETIEFEIQGDL